MFLLVYLRLYAHCLGQALKGVATNAWTLALPVGLFAARDFIIGFARGDFATGFIVGMIVSALYSVYLYFTGGTVAHLKMTLGEFKKSALVYLWSVVGLFFVLWIARLALGM